MLDPLDEGMDDWYIEEFPDVFAWIGPAASPALAAYLGDDSHVVYARICVAHGLREIAGRHPEARDDAVKALRDVLNDFENNDDSLNAFLVCFLLELKATEAAEEIERAYAADRVDVSVIGPWKTARQELGVEGLGLVPEHLASQRIWPHIPQFGTVAAPRDSLSQPSLPAGETRDSRRAKRKRERKNRKKSRRR